MFNIGSKEILIIAIAIMILFGSRKLNEWAKGIGEAGRELKKAKNEFTNAMVETEADLTKTLTLNSETDKKNLPDLRLEKLQMSSKRKV